MTDNNLQIDIKETKDNNHKPSVKRRALMKGAVSAVPVVLTLRSGAVFAAATTGSCITRDNKRAGLERAGNNGAEILVDPPLHDPWVRRQVWSRTLTEVGGGQSPNIIKVYNKVQEQTYQWEHPSNIPGNPNGSNIEFEEVTGGLYMRQSSATGPVGPNYEYTDSQICYILLHVDSTYIRESDPINFTMGNALEGVNNEGLPYVTESCWASVDPMGNNPIN